MEYVTIRNLQEMLINSPVLFTVEYLFFFSFFLAFLHAYRNGRNYLFLFALSFLPAFVVDPFCLTSDELRNYYHDHASILLYNRHVAPWQLCLFLVLAYVPTASVWKLGLPLLSEIGGSGLLAGYTFYVYDTLGAKYLLWTWHDSDPLYQDRTDGVPCGSSYWVISYAFSVALFTRLGLRFSKYSGIPLGLILLVFVILIIPLHLIPMIFYHYFETYGIAPQKSVHIFNAFCTILFLSGLLRSASKATTSTTEKEKPPRWNFLLDFISLLWYLVAFSIVFFVSPTSVQSTSVHQPFGVGAARCSEIESYYFGSMKRKKFLCLEDIIKRGVTSFDCLSKDQWPSNGSEWYTVCGTQITQEWLYGFGSNAVLAIALYLLIKFLASRKNKVD